MCLGLINFKILPQFLLLPVSILDSSWFIDFTFLFLAMQFSSGYLGGFPVEFLTQVVRHWIFYHHLHAYHDLKAQTSKILNVKKEAIKSLRDLNALGEKKVQLDLTALFTQ